MSNGSSLVKQRTFLGHPLGLYVLFFTEMWERFSYYGMRALLMLYMLNYFKWSQQDSSTIFKVYSSSVYITPILGGYLADRYLGNKMAVIIGAVLMAIGHFMMAFENHMVFIGALLFLIFGNGFFKPNMSTQVGRLYPADDGRRDGAYTIFYMGINLGACMSPFVCAWLKDHTLGGYHSGFTMAGIGMLLGLMIYLFGQPLVREIDQSKTPLDSPPPTTHLPSTPMEQTEAIIARAPDGVSATPRFEDFTVSKPSDPAAAALPSTHGRVLTEEEASKEPSVMGSLSKIVPGLLTAAGFLLILGAPVMWFMQKSPDAAVILRVSINAVMMAVGGGCLLLMAYVAGKVQGGMRDRVIAILTLGIFVMFFWAAFEQGGNTMNIWADKHTDRYLTKPTPDETGKVEVAKDTPKTEEEAKQAGGVSIIERFRDMFKMKPPKPGKDEDILNPVSTEWFQSINAAAIFVLAPLFAWLWIFLDRRGWQPSIPLKMAFGLVLISGSMGLMAAAARMENKPTMVNSEGSQLPPGLEAAGGKLAHKDKNGVDVPYLAGRLAYDEKAHTFTMLGVLPDNDRDEIIEETAPKTFSEQVDKLVKESEKINGEDVKQASVALSAEPPGFDMAQSGIKPSVVSYDAKDHTLMAHQTLDTKEKKGLLLAAGEPQLRSTIQRLYVESNRNRVSPWWLFWSFIIATLGELCLSPVGLSMVSKLAPAKFATMLMGVWMLTSAFGNYGAGALGEIWGTIPPIQFFLLTAAIAGGAGVVLFVIIKIVVRTMHGVK